jgi:hypothetical protein
MTTPRRLAVTLAAAGALASAAAPAASAHSHASSASVAVHSKRADRAIASLKRAVRTHHSRQARLRLAKARHEVAVAARLARSLSAAADTPAETVDAAGAVALATGQYTDLIAAVSELVDQVHGAVQQALAAALPPSVNATGQLLDLLNQLLAVVPENVKPHLAAAIAQLTADGTSVLSPMQTALTGGDLPVDIAQIVTTAIQSVTTALDTAMGQIAAIVPTLPAIAQGPVQAALNLVQGVLNMVMGQVGSFLPGGSSGPSGSSGPGSGAGDIAGGIFGQVNGLISQLLGGLLGGGGLPGISLH